MFELCQSTLTIINFIREKALITYNFQDFEMCKTVKNVIEFNKMKYNR